MITILAQLQHIDVTSQWDWSAWSQPFLHYPRETICSMLVGLACGVLGCFVVLRRMALIGDALSHAVLPGVVIAFIITQSSGILGLLLGALIAGLATAVLINLVSRHSRTKEDSAIGIVFTAFFALGVILISQLPRGVHFDLKCFLFGDPLAVMGQDLLLMAIICPLVLLIVAALYHPLKLASFDPVVAAAMGIPVVLLHYLLMGMLSATVVAGLKTTGVILVVAMVITPASAAYQLCNRFWIMLLLAGLFGAVAALVGMVLAFITNWPTGPAMVLVASSFFVAAMLFSPSHGLVFDRLRRWRLGRHIETEDVLKTIYKLGERGGSASVSEVSALSHIPAARVGVLMNRLSAEGMAETSESGMRLTAAGQGRAAEMVRAHRLWESYLADRANVRDPDLHLEAERLEHAHDLADEVDQSLGHPRRDPHGEKIPEKK